MEDRGLALGKPYASDLEHLANTYDWAMKARVDPLVSAITASASLSLLATGSGGSLTAAHLASLLHQRYAGRVSKAVTPIELVSSVPSLRDMTVLFVTAGGSNADIIGAFRRIVAHEPRRLIVMCARIKSPFSRLTARYRYVDLIDSTVVICPARVSMLPLDQAEDSGKDKGVCDGIADCGTCAGGQRPRGGLPRLV